MNAVILKSKGKTFSMWKEATIKKSMLEICPTFWLYTTDFSRGDLSQWEYKLGDECTIEICGKVVITGYIEDVIARTTKNGGNFIEISGREKICDLIDCSYNGDSKEWKNQNVGTLIQNICRFFSIDVFSEQAVEGRLREIVPMFSVSDGTTAIDHIVRLCNSVGVLPISKGDGKLTLAEGTKTVFATDKIDRAANILETHVRLSNKKRFSEYTYRGQGKNNEDGTISDWTQCTGKFSDSLIKRERPFSGFIFLLANSGKCEMAAKWKAHIAAGLSRIVLYTIPSWDQSDGTLWEINNLISVKDSVYKISDTKLIIEVEYLLTENSIKTIITVADKNTFSTASSLDIKFPGIDND